MANDIKKSEPNLKFFYRKESNYRTYHIDGVYGGITPQGNFFLDLYSERFPTPQMTEHKVNRDGSLSNPININGKDGIVRAFECGLVLDINVAKRLQKWLDIRIKQFEKEIGADK